MLGPTIFDQGNSQLLVGPLQVVRIGFKGYDLGKTTADTTMSNDQNIKDIMFQQDGTKPFDHVRTGQNLTLSATFGQISTKLLATIFGGATTANTSTSNDSATIGRNLYASMRDTEGGAMKIAPVDSCGDALLTAKDILHIYEAVAVVDAELINWGADTQRNLPVTWHIYFHKFAAGESSTKCGAFCYIGDNVAEDVPAIDYPDVEAPKIVTAAVDDATDLTVTFDENIAFQTSFDASHYIAIVEGEIVVPTAGVISTTALTLTFPAATFASGNVVSLTITDIALQDTETTPNTFGGVAQQPVTNAL